MDRPVLIESVQRSYGKLSAHNHHKPYLTGVRSSLEPFPASFQLKLETPKQMLRLGEQQRLHRFKGIQIHRKLFISSRSSPPAGSILQPPLEGPTRIMPSILSPTPTSQNSSGPPPFVSYDRSLSVKPTITEAVCELGTVPCGWCETGRRNGEFPTKGD